MTNSPIQYITVNPLPLPSKEQITHPSYCKFQTNKNHNNTPTNNIPTNNIPFNQLSRLDEVNRSPLNSSDMYMATSSSSDNECSVHSNGGHTQAQVQRVMNRNRRKRVQRSERTHRKLSSVSSCNSLYNCSNNKCSTLTRRELSTSYESINSDHSRDTCNESSFSTKISQHSSSRLSSRTSKKSSSTHRVTSRLSQNSCDSGFYASNTNQHNGLNSFQICHQYQKESIKKFVQDVHQYNQTNENVTGRQQVESKYYVSQTDSLNDNDDMFSDSSHCDNSSSRFWNSLMQMFNLGTSEKTQTQIYSVRNLDDRLERNKRRMSQSYAEKGSEWMADWRN